jgi:hypothetical protein
MGKYDSSKTRVEPVFEILTEKDSTGRSWLPQLLKLPVGGNGVRTAKECDLTISHCCWGPDERKLSPPVSLLSWLIRHPQELARCSAAHNESMPTQRRELLNGSDSRMQEALSLLRNNPHGANWHIFEGETQPDVFIETSDLIVVIEGKRTEAGPTTHTTWMPGRHQMIRHLDGAWEIRGNRQVVGFFVVEGESGGEEAPANWREFAKHTISPEALATSLPHRGPSEQNEIASCFAGVTTWSRVCREFEIDATCLPNEVPVDRARIAH